MILPKAYDFAERALFLVAIFVVAWLEIHTRAIACVLTMALPLLASLAPSWTLAALDSSSRFRP